MLVAEFDLDVSIFSYFSYFSLSLSNAGENSNYFIEDSPKIDGGRISISIKFSALVQSALCSLTGQPNQDCKLFIEVTTMQINCYPESLSHF